MKFPRALKITKASARVSAIFLRLSEVCRKIEADNDGVLATEARTFYCMSYAAVEEAYHLPCRLIEADALLVKLNAILQKVVHRSDEAVRLVTDGCNETRLAIRELRALVDEVKFTLDNAPVEPVHAPVVAPPPATPTEPVVAPKPHLPLAGKKPVDTSVKSVQVKPYSDTKVPYRPQSQGRGRFAQPVEPEIVVRRPSARQDDSYDRKSK